MTARVWYHLPAPRPRLPECDAVTQEVDRLRARFGGELIYLHPSEYTRVPLPRLLFGLRQLRMLRRRENEFDLHHIYNPDPFAYPYLRLLKKPIVYTIAAGLRTHQRIDVSFFTRTIARTVVSDDTTLNVLNAHGIDNARRVPPGIDTARFGFEPNELDQTLVLLCASAPWTSAQFRSKGIDALLDVAVRETALRLVFLWRGHLYDEMQDRVQQRGLDERVRVHNEVMDVNRMLADVHAAIVLAHDAGVIKAHPHSLLEALVAGRPVLVSRSIPMAEYIEREQCGVVVERVDVDAILAALNALRANYRTLQANARRVGERDFSLETMLNAYGSLYADVLERAA